MNPIIQAKNISKKYNITHQQGGYVALRDVLTNVAKKPFSFLKHKAKAAVGKAGKEEFWALKDVNFEIQKGEAVGIIGANGAGKSTLLKILTGITPPTTGEITMRGKVASLLEVGTGFHPELTGRENIFLNGAILGMTKQEISAKFNDIVEFAGIAKFIDTPVKRYSSGMYVRLAFSVAAHMEPDILLVDEVLAVGDAEFQKKCLGKMDEVTKKAGRTILFVSHNMSAIQNLCKRCILLKDGRIEMIGETKDVIDRYLNTNSKASTNRNLSQAPNRNGDNAYLRFMSFDVVDSDGKSLTNIPCGSTVHFELNFRVFSNKINNLRIGMVFKDQNTGIAITNLNSYYGSKKVLSCKKGNHKYIFTVKHFPLAPNQYFVGFIATSGLHVLDWLKDVRQLTVSKGLFYKSGQMPLSANSQIFFTEYTCGLVENN